MKRVISVIVLATLTTMVSGVNEASWAGQETDQQSGDDQRQRVVAQLNRIPVRTVVRIDRSDGSRVDGVLIDVGLDSITLTVLRPTEYEGRSLAIPIDEIERVEELRGGTLRKVLVGVGIALVVLVGACAVALNTGRSQSDAEVDDEPHRQPFEPVPPRDEASPRDDR